MPATRLCNGFLMILNMESIFLRVFSDNSRALKLYERLGFTEIQRIPLVKISKENSSEWIQAINQPYEEIKRYFIVMRINKNEWQKKT
ncbi:MAG: hypothetical protein MZU95_04240 [Desulfomicrobium escambiense]|nr:hypothetical protein [Desulfomicrobium escambiense]